MATSYVFIPCTMGFLFTDLIHRVFNNPSILHSLSIHVVIRCILSVYKLLLLCRQGSYLYITIFRHCTMAHAIDMVQCIHTGTHYRARSIITVTEIHVYVRTLSCQINYYCYRKPCPCQDELIMTNIQGVLIKSPLSKCVHCDKTVNAKHV